MRLASRSQRDPQRGDLLPRLPGRPVVVVVCVKQPHASSAVVAAAWGTGASAEAKAALTRDMHGRSGTGACRSAPCCIKRMAELNPQPLHLCTRLQSLRPRLEQSSPRPSCGTQCATFLRRRVAAPQGRPLPQHCCERAMMVRQSSLGGLF